MNEKFPVLLVIISTFVHSISSPEYVCTKSFSTRLLTFITACFLFLLTITSEFYPKQAIEIAAVQDATHADEQVETILSQYKLLNMLDNIEHMQASTN